jgi:predicted MFS family arabinose efflux permease
VPVHQFRSARVSVSLIFAAHGAVFGTFATRIPWIAERVHANPGALGLALIAPALGAVATMPLSAKLSHRFRSRPTVRVLMLAWCAALLLPALAPNLPLLFVALLGYGIASGMADVAMNAQGVVVEQGYGRSIMSGLHGLWSGGGLVASGIGALAAKANIDARLHFGVMAILLGGLAVLASRNLLNVQLPGEEAPAFALPSRAVLLVGLVGFCAVFAENGSADWCAVYLRTITHADPGVAASAFTAFAFAMTGGRLVGDQVIRRLGAVTSVRVGGIVAMAGAALVLIARAPAPAIAGFLLIGLGVSVVVPLAFTAAGSIGPNPAQAIASIATIAYGSGLAAPGAIGGIAQVSSLSVSFAVVGVLLLAMVFGAGALRPRQGAATAASPSASQPADPGEPVKT